MTGATGKGGGGAGGMIRPALDSSARIWSGCARRLAVTITSRVAGAAAVEATDAINWLTGPWASSSSRQLAKPSRAQASGVGSAGSGAAKGAAGGKAAARAAITAREARVERNATGMLENSRCTTSLKAARTRSKKKGRAGYYA